MKPINLIDLMSTITTDFSAKIENIDYKEFTSSTVFPDIYFKCLEDNDTRVELPPHESTCSLNPNWLRAIYDAHWNGLVFKKTEDWPEEADPANAAISDFLSCEQRNAETNRKLEVVLSGRARGGMPVEVFRNLLGIKTVLRDMLGDFSPSSVQTRFTSGATNDFSKGRSIIESVSPDATCTSNLAEYLVKYGFGNIAVNNLYRFVANAPCSLTPYYRNPFMSFDILDDTAKQFFIPKYWDKHRMGFTSPTVNMAVGSAYADHLEHLYKCYSGVDISYAADKHKEIAREGSLELNWSTIDKKNGSDLLAHGVLQLFPATHVEMIEALRIPRYKLVGDQATYSFHMLGHQGASTTFILESIFFYAIAQSVGFSREDCSVFGDDVALRCGPNDPRVDAYIHLAEFLGLLINKDKSLTGDYYARESCGGDYVAGVSVRPYYFKKVVLQDSSDVIKACNGIYDRYYDPIHRCWLDGRFGQLWYELINKSGVSYFGPYGGSAEYIIRANPEVWSYTSDRKDKILSLRFVPNRTNLSLFLSLDPSKIHGRQQVLYNRLHSNISVAVLHPTMRNSDVIISSKKDGSIIKRYYADLSRFDSNKGTYSEASTHLNVFKPDEPVVALSNHKVFKDGRFTSVYDFLDYRVKVRSHRKAALKTAERVAAMQRLADLLADRAEQLDMVVEW